MHLWTLHVNLRSTEKKLSWIYSDIHVLKLWYCLRGGIIIHVHVQELEQSSWTMVCIYLSYNNIFNPFLTVTFYAIDQYKCIVLNSTLVSLCDLSRQQ